MDPAATITSSGLDRQNPWPGLQAFGPGDSAFFYGRQAKIEEMFALVSRCPLSVFYGQSGLGKTSLLQAGLLPLLRRADFFPVLIRLDHGGDANSPSLADQVKQSLAKAIQESALDAPLPEADESLWAYFHRRELEFWDARNRNVHPVFVFDQFEEIYTRGRETAASRSRSEAFLAELEALTENRPPAELRRHLASNPEAGAAFDLDQQAAHVVLALREDFLPYLLRDRRRFTGVSYHQCRLERMTGSEAWDVLLQPGGDQLMDEETALAVLDAVAPSTSATASGAREKVAKATLAETEVDPALLSVVCRELNLARQQRGQPAISVALVDELQGSIMDQFYETALVGVSPQARQFIEDRLLSSSGDYRLAVAVPEAIDSGGITQNEIARLVDRRLLHVEDYRGQPHLELSHDRLTQVARTSRDERRKREREEAERQRAAEMAAAQRRRLRRAALTVGTLALAVLSMAGFGGWYWWHYVNVHVRYYASFTKKHGIAVGLGPQLTEEFVHHRQCSFKFIYNGSPERGKLSVMQAVRGDGQLTTQHSVATYLRTTEAYLYEDPKRECQWKFIANDQGEVVYEMAFDRRDHLVWGFVYAPSVPGSDERKAHFVGRDGFPQPGGDFGAEYVAIRYNENGFETRHRFLDATGEPHLGKDGAYGRAWEVSPEGLVLAITSLQRDGVTPMNDNAWNSTLRLEYDRAGREVRERTYDKEGHPCLTDGGQHGLETSYDPWGNLKSQGRIGLDLLPTGDNDGVCGYQMNYDEQGRRQRMSSFGVDASPCLNTSWFCTSAFVYNTSGHVLSITYLDEHNQPCLSKEGMASVEYEYNDQGFETARRFYDTHHHRCRDNQEKVSGYTSEYDDEGHVRSLAYLGIHDESILCASGTAGITTTYNQRGLETQKRFVGVDGKPCYNSEKVAGWASKYDEHEREVERMFLNLDGHISCAHKDGYFGWRVTYDDAGNLVRHESLDREGRLMTDATGTAGYESVFDDRGRETQRFYLGSDTKRCLHKDGYAGYEQTYEEHGKVARFVCLDLDGKPWMNPKLGVAGVSESYDERGRETMRVGFDADGKPCLGKDGYTAYTQSYNEHSWVVRTVWLDAKGHQAKNPVEGAAGRTATYDRQGHETQRSYFDAEDKPCVHKEGHAGTAQTYDDRGRLLRATRLGLDGQPWVNPADNIAGWSSDFDDRGNEIRRTYFGADGKPCLHKEGHAGYQQTFNERNQCTRYAWLDVAGKPWVNPVDNVAGWNSAYDADGNEVRRRFFGADGQPCFHKDGYAGWERTFAGQKHPIRFIWLDPEGRPWVSPKEHVAGWTSDYDSRGNEICRRYLGADSQPCLHTDGSAGWEETFDEKAQSTRYAWLDLTGKPWVNPGVNVAGWNSAYDTRGNEIRRTYFGPDGKPCLHKDGNAGYEQDFNDQKQVIRYARLDKAGGLWIDPADQVAGWTSDYDGHGNEIRRTYFGADGKPCLHKDGNAAWNSEFDARGNEIRRSYVGVGGKPCVITDGYAGYEQAYDNQGRVVHALRLGVDGQPWINPADNVAGWNIDYDSRGNEVRRIYLGGDGKPRPHKDGEGGYEQAFNDFRKITRYTKLDLEGKPWFDPAEGVAGWNIDYDANGNETRRTYFGADGKPCCHKDGYAGYEQAWDERGNMTAFRTLGLDGKPWLNPLLGYAGYTSTFDTQGEETKRVFVDATGKPTTAADGSVAWVYSGGTKDPDRRQAAELRTGQLVPVLTAIKRVVAGGEAERVGMLAGDMFLRYAGWSRLAGNPFRSNEVAWTEMMNERNKPGTEERDVEILRNGKVLKFRVNPGRLGFWNHDRTDSSPWMLDWLKSHHATFTPDTKP